MTLQFAATIGWVDHRLPQVAAAIHELQCRAYSQEARLLGVASLPAHERTAADVTNLQEEFRAVYLGPRMVALISTERPSDAGSVNIAVNITVNIASLVVDPDYQRRGFAKLLLADLFSRTQGVPLTVSTGAANQPALELYRRLGFVDVERWTLQLSGLQLVRLERPAQPG